MTTGAIAPAMGDAGVPPPPPRRRGLRHLRLPDQPLARNGLLTIAAGALCYLLSVSTSSNANFELAQVAAYTTVIAGLTLLVGGTGQLSLGHGALMAVGAYCYADFEQHQPHVPMVVGLALATAMTAAAGAIIGVAAARLRGPYLAGVTLALGLAVPDLADHYFNSDQGIPVNVTNPSSIEANHWLAWICLVAALITLFLLANLRRSRFHRSFTAVRENEISSLVSGINVARTQVLAFVLSAACAGLGGALLSLTLLGATSGEFPISLSILLVAAMVIGGMGSLVGSVWAGILIVYVPIWLDRFSNSSTSSLGANLPLLVFGALIIIIVIAAPRGIQGGVKSLARLLRRILDRLARDLDGPAA